MPISDQTIDEVLHSKDMKAVVDEPSTERKIRLEFEKVFEQVKGLLGDTWEDVRTIYDMSFDKTFDMSKEARYITIGALAYLVSPIDLLPERVLGPLGLADDAAVLYWTLNRVRPEVERYRAFKADDSSPS